MKTLVEQLQNYLPSCTRDAHAKQAMIDLAMAYPDEMHDRHFHTPGHFTCSAIITNPEGTHVLSNFHAKCLTWMHFGGHWERSNVSAFQMVLHEVDEEVFNHPEQFNLPDLKKYGLCSPLGDAIFDVSVGDVIRDTEAKHKHFDIRFLFTLPMSCITAISKESVDMKWMTFEEALKQWTQDPHIDVHRLLSKTIEWHKSNVPCEMSITP